MNYPRLCKNCGKPFTGKNLYNVFCSKDCGIAYYQRIKELKPKKKIAEIEKDIKREWEDTETNPTQCYKCGAKMDYWTFEYASRYGRVCKRCASGHKCNISSNKTST